MKRSIQQLGGAAAALLLGAGICAEAHAEQRLRVQVDQRGDFVLIGNTLGWDCGAGAAAPIVGVASTNNCGAWLNDTSPDIFWRSEDPQPGQATASLNISAANARSSALLKLPAAAQVTHAFLYWGARRAGSAADTSVTLDRPGGFSQSVTALTSYTATPFLAAQGSAVAYQSVADVTALVSMHGPGVYRVSGVDVDAFRDINQDVLYAGWALVVLYRLDTDPPRNLAVFDGLDGVASGSNSDVTLSGFVVPNAGFDAKLGAIVYEGDTFYTGDSLLFGANLNSATPLADGQNPANDFFNGSRSFLGQPVSVSGDLPQLAGTPGTMASVDLDVIDITPRVSAGQTSVAMRATTNLDAYYMGAFITSISTFRPDFISSEKKVSDVNGGYVKAGDELEYTISLKNTGNDASAATKLTDPLPAGVSFVPGSIRVVDGPNAGVKTDAAGDDQASYDAQARALTVFVGTGATASAGGSLAANESSTVSFRVKVDAGVNGVISNQGRIDAAGARGAPPTTTLTDGNGAGPGNPPTDIPAGSCMSDMQCGGKLPFCDKAAMPPMCAECTMDSHCMGPMSRCDPMTRTCVCPGKPGSCIDTDGDGLPDPDEDEIGTDKTDADSDDDGVPDGKEIKPGDDSDGDGKRNALDPDSDNDMLKDGTEQGFDCSNPATDVSKQQCKPDGDMGATKTDPLDADTDDGGARDGSEDTNLDGVVDRGERNPTAGHGADDGNIDTDGDGISDGDEDDLGTDKTDADTDDDGVRDGDEDHLTDDTDGDGVINPLDADSDGDGIFDGTETGRGCDEPDTNRARGRCIPDADHGQTVTSPIDADTDDGGISDGEEDRNHNGAIDPGEADPNMACDDNPLRSCDTGFGSLAGAGGCSLDPKRAATRMPLALLMACFVAVWLTRRRPN